MPVKLYSVWLWQFYVKTRSYYKLQAFDQSYCQLLKPTNDFERLIKAINLLPPLGEHWSSNIALFRDGIRNVWEDSENVGASIIYLTLNDCSSTEKDGKYNTLPADDLQALFVAMVMFVLLHEKKQINGLYVKSQVKSTDSAKAAKHGDNTVHTYAIQIWVKNDALFDQVKAYLHELGIEKEVVMYKIQQKKYDMSTPKRDVKAPSLSRSRQSRGSSRYRSD